MEVLVGGSVVVLAILFLPRVVWWCRIPFCALNQFEWVVSAPARFVLASKKYEKVSARPFLRWVLFPARVLWWIMVWLFGVPVRLVSALYWDGALYTSCAARDAILHFLRPARGEHRRRRGVAYLSSWLIGAPLRLVITFKELVLVFISSTARIAVSTAVPTITAYHGTRFEGCASDVGQQGRWLVGSRQYVGAGIYFAPTMKGATHYAAQRGDHTIVVARISPGWTTWPSSWRDSLRKTLGHAQGGTELSRYRPHPFSAFEHPRDHWWEICLPYHREAGSLIRPWRVRGVCVVRSGSPQRLWHGLAVWPSRASEWAVVAASLVFIALLASTQ